ncbi:MAG: prolyl oligopeptidase family serine peptidase [Phenylobacterium sp.]|uniref:prolyl oligopeptidase family serine peptidase n=1 Tax=Phenylobacterium sp. TaxID=1871053 RepID=UPI0025ED629F|nr:prolyl oligopeptidase family serine peptidase [Phenylobacterium sp.]MBI1197824.1 prolyl oligopeptidase family serine peptidase [Phenylobacterium sp.]
MKSLVCAVAALALAPLAVHAEAAQPDPFAWLEDVDSAKSMAWVEQQNARTADRLEKDPRYEVFRKQALAIFTAQDRIPMPRFRAGGVDNLWQDAAHVHGLWRHASLESYRTETPAWDTLIDLDALSKAEGRNWFFKGATCLKPAETLCLVRLSDGGGDAVEIREFDIAKKAFVEGGFRFPTGKQSVDWIDKNTLLVAREWTPGEVTTSGYAYVVKILNRGGIGQQLAAGEVFRGEKTDVSAQPSVLHGEGGLTDGVIVNRAVTFFESEYSLATDHGLVRIPLPPKADYQAYVSGQVVFDLKEAWNGFGAGAVIAYDLTALKADAAHAKPTLIFQPGPRQAVQQIDATDGRLVIALLEDVKGAIDVYAFKDGAWASKRLPLPQGANLTLVDTDGHSDRLFATAEGFLDPTSLWLADAAADTAGKVKALPPRFDASKDVVEQFWATSSDGTKIPYFVVCPKDMKPDGSTPTIMYGYGGFEVAKPPIYLPEMGRIWLERGGAYVIANIRGGGEFGPAWHQSVLREKRQLAFDDFAAVAKDLAARGITSPRRLGIYGRSNGGVLTSVSITQHPELWNAAVIESPLIDMLRYNHLSAGASWVGEYGDPDVPADRAFIARYSAYQNLKPGVKYPEPYITTNTRDDRVHPGHARKFAAALAALGDPYLYYEQTFGGHANDADPELNARRWARHYVYLAQKLMD